MSGFEAYMERLDLRATDSQREGINDLLSDAYAKGQLSMGELNKRREKVYEQDITGHMLLAQVRDLVHPAVSQAVLDAEHTLAAARRRYENLVSRPAPAPAHHHEIRDFLFIFGKVTLLALWPLIAIAQAVYCVQAWGDNPQYVHDQPIQFGTGISCLLAIFAILGWLFYLVKDKQHG